MPDNIETPRFILINGSENRDGSTANLLEYARSKLENLSVSAEVLHLSDYAISPCGACGDCNWRSVECEVDDSMPYIVERLKAVDGLIYAAPVHGFGLSSTMQVFIERLGVGYLRFERPLVNKLGGVIVVGRRYSHSSVVAQLQQNMLLNRMIIPGSGYPAIVCTEKGNPFEDDEGIASVSALCVRLAEVARAFNFGAAKGTGLASNERVF